jgi:hypothetical protein
VVFGAILLRCVGGGSNSLVFVGGTRPVLLNSRQVVAGLKAIVDQLADSSVAGKRADYCTYVQETRTYVQDRGGSINANKRLTVDNGANKKAGLLFVVVELLFLPILLLLAPRFSWRPEQY